MSDENVQIPDKLYFKIGEVAAIVGVKPYVLRYWESEFHIIKPTKTQSKHRLYRRKDVETLLQIKHLLYDERFTIEGAKRHLKNGAKGGKSGSGEKAAPAAVAAAPAVQKEEKPAAQNPKYQQELRALREEMRNLLRLLQS